MGNQSTFGKRQREQNRKDKARAKQERLAARRAEGRPGNGPPIASFAEAHALVTAGSTAPENSMPPDPAITAPSPVHEVHGDRPDTPPVPRPRGR